MKVRLTVVSHACVLAANQSVYAQLGDEFTVTMVVPRKWRDALRRTTYRPAQLAALDGPFVPVRTWFIGRPQRHVAVVRAARLLRLHETQFLIVEEEPFSVAAAIWTRAARRARVPYAVQVAENRPRSMPAIVRWSCHRVLAGASFVLARSPAALRQANEWGYDGPATIVAHGIDLEPVRRAPAVDGVVGFVGRLVAAKGVSDLVAVLNAHPNLRLRVAGDGDRRAELLTLGERVELLGTLPPQSMSAFYDSLSVLAVPSRTTATWSEQFGRVVVEAQARTVPVVAYDSGEIAWVASLTTAAVVSEGDVAALGRGLEQLATDHDLARTTGERGRELVATTFANDVIAATMASAITNALSETRGSRAVD